MSNVAILFVWSAGVIENHLVGRCRFQDRCASYPLTSDEYREAVEAYLMASDLGISAEGRCVQNLYVSRRFLRERVSSIWVARATNRTVSVDGSETRALVAVVHHVMPLHAASPSGVDVMSGH